jgi:hypothetical protein
MSLDTWCTGKVNHRAQEFRTRVHRIYPKKKNLYIGGSREARECVSRSVSKRFVAFRRVSNLRFGTQEHAGGGGQRKRRGSIGLLKERKEEKENRGCPMVEGVGANMSLLGAG